MSAVIIRFPNAPEPPVALDETLAAAARRHALSLLTECFGPEYGARLSALHAASTLDEIDRAIAAFEDRP